jgi:hypothetical protein
LVSLLHLLVVLLLAALAIILAALAAVWAKTVRMAAGRVVADILLNQETGRAARVALALKAIQILLGWQQANAMEL